MSQPEIPFSAVAPYIQPANWGGNRIGVDPLPAPPRPPIPFAHHRDAIRTVTD